MIENGKRGAMIITPIRRVADSVPRKFIIVVAALLLVILSAGVSMFVSNQITRAAGLPSIASFTFTNDADGNPTEIQITGTNYDADTRVLGRLSNGFQYIPFTVTERTDTFLRATIPPNLEYGSYNLSVFDINGLGSSYGNAIVKTAPRPIISNVESFIEQDVTDYIEITGSKFESGTNLYACNQSTNECFYVVYATSQTPTFITAEVNTTGLPAGTYRLGAWTANGPIGTYNDAFVIEYPELDISNEVLPGGDVKITVTGAVPQNIASLIIGGGTTATVSSNTANSLIATIPAGHFLSYDTDYDVEFVKSSGYRIIYPNTLNIAKPPPAIYQIDNYPAEDGSLILGVTGFDLTDDMTVTIGGVAIASDKVFIYPTTYIEVYLDGTELQPGTYDFTLTDSQGVELTLTDGVTIASNVPSIDLLNVAQTEQYIEVTIEGTNLNGAIVAVEGVDTTVISQIDTLIVFSIPYDTAPREHVVTITKPQGTDSATFIVEDIFQVGISHAETYADGPNYYLSISGENFRPDTVMTLDGIELEITYQSDGYLEAIIPDDMTVGNYELKVSRADGQTATYSELVRVAKPVVSGVVFSTQQDGRVLATVNGERLVDNMDMLTDDAVLFNDQALQFCVFDTPYTLQDLFDWGYPVEKMSEQPPCFKFFNEQGEQDFSDTQLRIVLPANYDKTARGTVSIHGRTAFVFNNATPVVTTPTATIDQKQINTTPTVSTLPTFSGQAPAGSHIVVTVRSDPVTCETTAGSNGLWSCTLSTALPAGAHTASIVVTTLLGQVFDLGTFPITVAAAAQPSVNKPTTPIRGIATIPIVQNEGAVEPAPAPTVEPSESLVETPVDTVNEESDVAEAAPHNTQNAGVIWAIIAAVIAVGIIIAAVIRKRAHTA